MIESEAPILQCKNAQASLFAHFICQQGTLQVCLRAGTGVRQSYNPSISIAGLARVLLHCKWVKVRVSFCGLWTWKHSMISCDAYRSSRASPLQLERLPYPTSRNCLELQRNALDNCASACACKARCLAVNSSTIKVLHLHMDTVASASSVMSKLEHWSACLAARSNIKELKMSAQTGAVKVVMQSPSLSDSLVSPLSNILLGCSSLRLDEHFAPCLGQYTDQLAQVQHLSLNYGQREKIEPRKDPLKVLPVLTHLTHLRSLKVEVSGRCKDALAQLLSKCPDQLESCYIGAMGDWGLTTTPKVMLTLRDSLRQLVRLELHMCGGPLRLYHLPRKPDKLGNYTQRTDP